MSVRVLLVSVNREDQPHPVYPLALEHLAAALRAAGHEARLLDVRKAEADGIAIAAAIRAARPDLVGVSVRNVDNNQSAGTKDYLPELLAVMAEIRQATPAPVVLGGSGYSLFPREILRLSGADAGVAGPGEEALVVLAGRAAAAAPLDRGADIPGLVVRRGVVVVETAPGRPDALPGVPDRDPDLVRHYWREGGPLSLQVSRGCPWGCAYCTYPLLEGRRAVRRDASAAVDEIQGLQERTGVGHFFVVDSVFNADPALADAFAGEILRRKLRVTWSAFLTPKGVTRERAERWKASGLEGAELGVDALCDPVLRAYGKPFDAREARAAVAACAAADLPCIVYLILGGPGETRATLEETVAAAGALPRAVVCAFAGMRVYPGTALAARAAAEGVVPAGASLLAPRFYFSPGVDAGEVARRCAELGMRANWLVVGGGLEAKFRAAAALRKRGRKGSLWQALRPAPEGKGTPEGPG
jgi:radical SAM superfamily enzyme YgiQ (UPF0313 family)